MASRSEKPAGKGPGGTIGKYEIVDRIGSGGFGTVFRAWDPVIKRPVAIKVCDAGRDVRARFLREAELAGRLHHPNITTVYECGTEGETPFMVQEFLDGEDLSALIARKEPADLVEKIKILVGISIGLEYAHRAGVVHRDVKPANVRILGNGMVKIMDFGIAKALDAPSGLTGTGVTVGSSGYMAPEQVSGDPVDARTDIFSFGVLAYELLSNQKPFASENLFRLLEMIVKEEPEFSVARLVPGLPPELAEIVERSMRKNPDERFSSMRELRAALVSVHPAAAAAAEGETAPPEPLPEAEERRVRALERYGILDTPREKAFDELALLAARVCEAPLARISFLDGGRRWTKAAVGPFGRDAAREAALCARAIRQKEVLVVADTRGEAGPSAGEAEAFRFYAGAPLVTPDGFAIGTLCVLDQRPRQLSDDQRSSLRVLAAQVVAQLELRRYRRHEAATSGEKLLLEIAGLTDPEAPGKERPDG